MPSRRSPLFLRRLVRIEGRKVIARFLREPNRAAVLTFPTHADARRAAARLLVQYRLSETDEEWDEKLLFRTELIRAVDALSQSDDSSD